MRSKAASRSHAPGRPLLFYRTGLRGILCRKTSCIAAVATVAEAAPKPLAPIAAAIAMAAITIAATAVAIIIIIAPKAAFIIKPPASESQLLLQLIRNFIQKA